MIQVGDFITESHGLKWIVGCGVVPFHRARLGYGRQRPGHRMFVIGLGHLPMAGHAGLVPNVVHLGLNIAILGFESQTGIAVADGRSGMKEYFGSRPSPGQNYHANQKHNDAQPTFPGIARSVGNGVTTHDRFRA